MHTCPWSISQSKETFDLANRWWIVQGPFLVLFCNIFELEKQYGCFKTWEGLLCLIGVDQINHTTSQNQTREWDFVLITSLEAGLLLPTPISTSLNLKFWECFVFVVQEQFIRTMICSSNLQKIFQAWQSQKGNENVSHLHRNEGEQIYRANRGSSSPEESQSADWLRKRLLASMDHTCFLDYERAWHPSGNSQYIFMMWPFQQNSLTGISYHLV